MFKAELVILVGKLKGRRVPITDKKFYVGREADCHLRPTSDMVSRHHCVFLLDQFTLRLRDLGSMNGTFVNGVKLEGITSLHDGDHIRVGLIDLEIRLTSGLPLNSAASGPQSFAGDEDTAPILDSEKTSPQESTITREDLVIVQPANLTIETAIPIEERDKSALRSSTPTQSMSPDKALPSLGWNDRKNKPPSRIVALIRKFIGKAK